MLLHGLVEMKNIINILVLTTGGPALATYVNVQKMIHVSSISRNYHVIVMLVILSNDKIQLQ